MKKIIFIIITILCCSIAVSAHTGSLDEYGGHYHVYDGKRYYHYHHGYDAHQHPDGHCPYEEGWIDPYQDAFDSQAMKDYFGTYSNAEALKSGNVATEPYEVAVVRAAEQAYKEAMPIAAGFCFLCSLIPLAVVLKMKRRKINGILIFAMAFFTPPLATMFTIALYDIYIPSGFATMWVIGLSVVLEIIYFIKHRKTEEQTPIYTSYTEEYKKKNSYIDSQSKDERHLSRYYSPQSQFSNDAIQNTKKTQSSASLIPDEIIESYKRGHPSTPKSFIDEWNEKYSNEALAKQDKNQTTPQPQKVKVKPVKRK